MRKKRRYNACLRCGIFWSWTQELEVEEEEEMVSKRVDSAGSGGGIVYSGVGIDYSGGYKNWKTW